MSEDETLLGLMAMGGLLPLPIAMAAIASTETDDTKRNQARKTRYANLTKEERSRRQRRVPAPSLPEPEDSPWNQIFYGNQEEAFITTTGLDRACFSDILQDFAPIFDNHSPYSLPEDDGHVRQLPKRDKKGRPRKVKAHSCLGLTLFWTRTTCYQWTMGPFFGMVSTCVSLWLRFGKRVLARVLMNRPEAQIRMPSDTEVLGFINAVSKKHPALLNVGYVGDGMKILFEKASDHRKQSMFYNGWKGDHFITNLFVFAPNGKIVAAILNCPGTMHDSELAMVGDPSVYQKLDAWYETYGLKCVMDSAFCTTNRQSIIKSIPREKLWAYSENLEHARVLDQALSLRQSAEWGMRALQGAMPRLKTRWPFEERGERDIGLTMLALLFNYKAERMGLNQIRNVYWPGESTQHGEGDRMDGLDV